MVCEVQNGQGISDNGRKYTFTIRYPAVTRMAQTITVDTSDRAATCTELLPARAASAKGTLSYESSNSAVASVDPVTGIITAHTAGEVTIIIRAAQTETYEAAETSYKLIVSHRYAGEWTADEAEHWKECVCGAKGELAAHTDEAATCVAKAKCKICGREHGDLNPMNHAGLRHVPAKEATKAEDGNIEYWYCADCGKYFRDAEARTEITKEETVLPKLPELPKTGDSSQLLLWFALLLMSAGILAASMVRGKKNQQTH